MWALLIGADVPGAEWQWKLPWTKGQGYKGHVTVLRVCTESWRCPLWWLRTVAWYLLQKTGVLLPNYHPVFYTHYGELDPSRGASTQQIEGDVKAVTRAAGLAEQGYTMYSLKRGTLIEGRDQVGESWQSMKRRSGVESERVLKGYLDCTRNTHRQLA